MAPRVIYALWHTTKWGNKSCAGPLSRPRKYGRRSVEGDFSCLRLSHRDHHRHRHSKASAPGRSLLSQVHLQHPPLYHGGCLLSSNISNSNYSEKEQHQSTQQKKGGNAKRFFPSCRPCPLFTSIYPKSSAKPPHMCMLMHRSWQRRCYQHQHQLYCRPRRLQHQRRRRRRRRRRPLRIFRSLRPCW